MITEVDIEKSIESIRGRVVGSGNRPWTAAVKSAFVELGRKHDWLICASSSEAGVEPEWLWDLTMYRRPNDDDLELGLVLESEWSSDYFDLRFDFEKLLVAKAPFKVFIFESYGAAIEDTFARLNKAVDRCAHSSAGETYFFACYNPPEKQFVIRKKKVPNQHLRATEQGQSDKSGGGAKVGGER